LTTDPRSHQGLGGEAGLVRQQVRAPPGGAEDQPGLEQADEDPELAGSVGPGRGDETERVGRDEDVESRSRK